MLRKFNRNDYFNLCGILQDEKNNVRLRGRFFGRRSAVISHSTELLADDCVHPNAKGNVELARHMLILLKNLGLGGNTEPVILTPGMDYNFYRQSFGNVFGTVVWQLVRFLTGNVPGIDI